MRVSLERLTTWAPDDPAVGGERRRVGALLAQDLAAVDLVAPDRAAPLLRLLAQGEPVASADLHGLRETTIRAGIDAGLFAGFDIDGSRYLRATACVLPDRLPGGDPVWVACDLPWEAGRTDHVPGPGNASRTLMNALAVNSANVAADIGTGCGIVALHLSTFAERVMATDLSPRALAFAELTAALNGRAWELRLGSFLEPIAGDSVDLIVANPPFVIGNPDEPSVFRDGALSLAASFAADVAAALPAGGVGQFLGNWAYVGTDDPTWLVVAAAGEVECLVVERAVVLPEDYVPLWTDDAERRARWAANLRGLGVGAIGTGLVTLHRATGSRDVGRSGVARVYEAGDESLGSAVAEWLAG